MAKLVNIFRTDKPVDLTKRQLPLTVDRHLTMIMDLKKLEYVCQKRMDPCIETEFMRKFNILTDEELRTSLQVPQKELHEILRQTVPCNGCRRSVERFFDELMKLKNDALDPLTVTVDGIITVSERALENPSLLCSMLHNHSDNLFTLLEKQPRNKKSQRCALHSLEVQRARPGPLAWREAWGKMAQSCREQLTLVENETLEKAVENYLRKHRFCGECRTKVLLASNLLMTEIEPTKEKGYVPALYAGIKRCISDGHLHLPTDTEYIKTLMDKSQADSLGRERHAKTLDVAQEEVLTCLGICVAEKLHRVYRKLREEETIVKVFAAVGIDALARNFETSVEVKQGMTQLELLYKELEHEKMLKQQRREKLRLKRKRKKERRQENTEEKENTCDFIENINDKDNKIPCDCMDKKSIQNDRKKHQVFDSKLTDTINFLDCQFDKKMTNCKLPLLQKNKFIEESKVNKNKETISIDCIDDDGKLLSDDTCLYYKGYCDKRSDEFLKWMRVSKTRDLTSRASSEPSSQDCGYSSEHNASNSSLPSSPEGSEVACSEACCGREREECRDSQLQDKFDNHSMSSVFLLRKHGSGPTLSQMLEDCNTSDDEGTESYISMEEVQEFNARTCQLQEKRLELRKTLRHRFAMLCNYYKQSGIPR